MLKAIYPGSFDPVTRGHYDIICRSCKIVDKLIVGVLNNKAKMPLFSVEERVKMLKEVTKDLPNVEIIPFDGLLVDFAEQIGADVVIRGLRAITDFEYELHRDHVSDNKYRIFLFKFDYSAGDRRFWRRRITVCAGSRRDRT